MFHVGQKVVCVDDTVYPWSRGPLAGLTKGRIYTVRELDNRYSDGLVGVRVEEILLPHLESPICREDAFLSSRFRPVKTTDISIFTDILKTVETPPREKVGGENV